MLPKESGIYIITNLTNGKVYIGQAKGAKGIYERHRGHMKRLKRGSNSPHLQCAWDHYGPSSFTFEVLLLCSPEQCDYWEEYFIEKFQSWKRTHGYNIDKLTRGPGTCAEETKRKISEANVGRRYGPRSEEVKRLISEKRKAVGNKPRTAEMNKKNGDSHRGTKHKPFSEEAKQKLSQIHKGMRWITDGQKSTQTKEPPPKGWWYGRTQAK